MSRTKCLFLTLFLILSNLSAQDRVFKFLTVKDGLPSNTIFKIRFDKKGFLWIAHDKGISRYDGITFKNYTNPSQKSNVYTDLYIGPDDKVWMTNLGLQVFYIEHDEMKLYRSFDLKNPPSTLRIVFLKNGNMVFNAQGGITEIDSKTGKEYIQNLEGPIQNIYEKDGIVYFLHPKTGKLCSYQNRQLDSGNSSYKFPPVLINDRILINSYNTSNKLNVYSKTESRLITQFDLKYNYNYSEEIAGKFLIFTTGNIQHLHFKDDSISSTVLLEGHSFTHYSKDILGNEWYSTLNDGILFLPAGNCLRLGVNTELMFMRLLQFRNNAYCISKDNKLFQLIKNELHFVGDFNSDMNYKPIILFKNLNDQKLIMGNSRFLLLDSSLSPQPYFPELSIKDICLDNGKNVYFATSGTIFRHPYLPHIFEKIQTQKSFIGLESSIRKYPVNGRFNCVAFDSTKSTLYFGGIPGFYMQKEGMAPMEINDRGNSIYTTVMDFSKPYLLVGTIQSGIYILKDNRILKHFNSKNSSIGNTIIKIKHYKNYIWILSEKGLHQLDIPKMSLLTYTNVGAVNLNNCNDFTISGDQIYLISGQNLYSVELLEFVKSLTPVPVYFKSVQTGNSVIYDLNNLHLKYNQNSFTIRLDIPAAMVLGNVEFEYTLNSSQWFLLNKGQTDIYINQLSPGFYHLSVRQKGMQRMYTLAFTIEAPFWTTWWFYLLIIVFIALITLLLYRNRVNIIRQKSKAEIEKFKLEKALQQNILSSIKSQMNPHFLFNALNTIQSYIYLNDKKQAINYLGKFSELTRKILDQSNYETITLSEEHETLELYLQLEKMRFENTLVYSIVFTNIPFKDQFRIPPMLIQPYVENAVKHGLMHKPNNRILEIRFRHNSVANLIEVAVEDNGIGRKKANEINEKRIGKHKPFSTEANRTRLEILNKENKNPISVLIIDKTDEYGNANGTLVQINIPVL